MAKIHMILQGKGGVGKSMAAAMLAQYKLSQGKQLLCIDTDPVNSTFAGYKSLDVQLLDIMDGDEINPRNFDTLLAILTEAEDEVVVDNGASCFVPLSSYLIANDVPVMLQEMGHKLIVHTVITGGQALMDTLRGLHALMKHFTANCLFVVWLNPYFGRIEDDGIPFEKMKIYETYKERISGRVEIPLLKAETFGRDFSEMMQGKQTFDEVLSSPALHLMVRQRLTMIRRKIFEALDNVPVL